MIFLQTNGWHTTSDGVSYYVDPSTSPDPTNVALGFCIFATCIAAVVYAWYVNRKK